jgi:hypothetical protein
MFYADEDSFEKLNGCEGVHFKRQDGSPVVLDKQGMREAHIALSTPCEGGATSEDWERLERIKGLAELFDEVLFWCWNVRIDGGYKIRKYRAAQNRFVAITALVKPDVFNGDSYELIAGRLGITKQLLSNYAKEFQEEFGLKFQRSHRAYTLHSSAAKKSWKERKSK